MLHGLAETLDDMVESQMLPIFCHLALPETSFCAFPGLDVTTSGGESVVGSWNADFKLQH